MDALQDMCKRKDQAYWERQQMVVALSHLWPSFLAKHPESDKEWQDDWRTIVVIILPEYGPAEKYEFATPRYSVPGMSKSVRGVQITWHIHDFEIPLFDHLRYADGEERTGFATKTYQWDGHTTEEKYRRLREFFKSLPPSAWERGYEKPDLVAPELPE